MDLEWFSSFHLLNDVGSYLLVPPPQRVHLLFHLQAQAARADRVSMKNHGWVWGEGNQKEYQCSAKSVPEACAQLEMG